MDEPRPFSGSGLGMEPELWRRADEILDAALQLADGERERFVAVAANDDRQLHRQLLALLAAHHEAGDFLASSPFVVRASGSGERVRLPVPERAGPYRLLDPLGSGGMGVVFRAERVDGEFERRVAVKLLHPFASPEAERRFLAERRILAGLDHPHIARMYDAGTTPDGVPYLVMELVEGVPMLRYCAEHGSRLEERIELFLQVCSAVHYAHERGVIHRDLKPGNVLVTADGVVKLLDFGIAKLLRAEAAGTMGGEETLSLRLLTPAYASPEQILGAAVAAPSDVYSLGLLLFELMTGAHPFRGAGAAAVSLAERVSAPPPRASRRLLSGLLAGPSARPAGPRRSAPRWRWRARLDRILRRALSWRAGDRYPTVAALAAEVAALCDGRTTTGGWQRPAMPAARNALRRRAMLIVPAAALALLAPAPHDSPPSATEVPGAATVPDVRSVAVVGFENLTAAAEAAWIATALEELLALELDGAALEVVAAEEVAEMRRDLRLSPSGRLAADTLQRVRRRLGADLVVVGSYLVSDRQGGTLRLQLVAQDTASGAVVASHSETGARATLDEMVVRAGLQLRSAVGGVDRELGSGETLLHGLPAHREAARLYAAGLARLRTADAVGARPLLERAAAIEPGSALIHSELAMVYAALGLEARAAAAAARGSVLAAALPAAQRLVIEARHRELEADWPGAVEAYRRLLADRPGAVEIGLRLAAAQAAAGEGRAALATLDACRRAGARSLADPRLDLAEAEISIQLADFERAHRAARRAIARGITIGARQLVARARLQEARAYWRQGHLRQAEGLGVVAADELLMLGDDATRVDVLNLLGNLRHAGGDLDGAAASFEEAVQTARRLGARRKLASALGNRGQIPELLGDPRSASAYFGEAVAVAREVADPVTLAASLCNLASSAMNLGDLAGAAGHYQEARGLAQRHGLRLVYGWIRFNEASLARLRGDLPAAVAAADEAVAVLGDLDAAEGVGWALMELGDARLEMDALAAAAGAYRQARDRLARLDDRCIAAQVDLGDARLALARQQPARAVTLARAAAATLGHCSQRAREAAARGLAARGLLASGDLAAGRRELELAGAALGGDPGLLLRGELELVSTWLGRASGSAGRQAPRLDALAAEAELAGWQAARLEAELLSALLALEAGGGASAPARLQERIAATEAAGFRRLAREARSMAALQGSP